MGYVKPQKIDILCEKKFKFSMYTLFYSILPMFMNGILNIFNIEINSAVNILPIFNNGSILPIFNIRINNTIRYKSL